MPDYLQIARFPLPDDLTPDGTMCVKIRIPDDQQYLGTLIGLLDMLKWSENFDRDPTKLGAATVSRTWQSALESEPIEVEGCDMPDFRINPETCLLEVDCSDDGTDWQPVFTPAYDPTEDAPPVALYPDPPPEGESNECLAAENVTAMFINGTSQFATLLSEYGTLGQIAALLYTMLSGLVAMVQANLWFTLLEVDWGGFDHETIMDDYGDFDWDSFKNLIVCYFESDGSISPAGHLNALNEMETHGGQIWRLIRLVWSLAGSIGISLATHWAGITDGECDACGWSSLLDFEISDQDFEIYVHGHYVGGEGFKNGVGFGSQEAVYCQRTFPEAFAITKCVMTVEGCGVGAEYQGAAVQLHNGGGLVVEGRDNAVANTGGEITIDGSYTLDKILCAVNVILDTPQPVATIISVYLEGVGEKPAFLP